MASVSTGFELRGERRGIAASIVTLLVLVSVAGCGTSRFAKGASDGPDDPASAFSTSTSPPRSTSTSSSSSSSTPAAPASASANSSTRLGTWAERTSSPTNAGAHLGDGAVQAFAPALRKCGASDGKLDEAATALEAELGRGGDLSHTTETLRRVGSPYVWPRVWVGTATPNAGDANIAPTSTKGPAVFDVEDVTTRIERWRAGMPTSGHRRCGTSGARKSAGGERAVFLTVDALADLAPLPTRTHAGSWLTVDATMLVPATHARVVLVGPDGRPRPVPTSMEGSRIRAKFAPDRPGRFAVQVLADIGAGPRPVLEAIVFADVEPYEDKAQVPGESAAQGENTEAALVRMILGLRSELGLAPFRRDAGLDALARAHALRMKAVGRVGHDVGDGDPKTRIERSDVVARRAGENVAHAENVTHAHRALYASPSHRENLIHPDFDRFGLAVVTDTDGTVWVAELFAR